jgi:hypothetical protein
MTDRTPRRRTVSVSFTDDGNASLALHTAPDALGKQGVAETLVLQPVQVHESLQVPFMLRGVVSTFSNIYNRLENPSASDLRAAYDKFIASVTDGTWTPGRTFAESEPDDIVIAIAEVVAQPVHVVQQMIDDMLTKTKMNADGTVAKDKAGRTMHVYRKADLYKTFLDDPRKGANGHTVKQVVARLTEERAKRLAREARESAKAAPTGALDMFTALSHADTEPTAEAA